MKQQFDGIIELNLHTQKKFQLHGNCYPHNMIVPISYAKQIPLASKNLLVTRFLKLCRLLEEAGYDINRTLYQFGRYRGYQIKKINLYCSVEQFINE